MKKLLFILALMIVSTSLMSEGMNYKRIYKEVAPGVVLLFGSVGQVGSTGTGSIVDEKGTIITNAHVVINPSTHKPYKNLTVFLKPEKVTGKNKDDLKYHYTAEVIKYDEEMDLAAVRITNLGDKELTPVVIADSKDIMVGEPTVAIGHPEQGSRWSLTTGAISGRIEDFNGIKGKNVFQMETAVNRGNSGGPLLDYRGYLIGINSMIARESKDGLAIVGINFAIDSNSVIEWLDGKGIALEMAGSDGIPVERDTQEVNNKSGKSSLFVKKSKNDEIVVKNSNTTLIDGEEEMSAKLKPADKNVKVKTQAINKKFRFRIRSKRKYRKRSKRTRNNIIKKKYVSGKTYTEKDIVNDKFKPLRRRSKKAHKRLNKKLGSWDDDNVPGFGDSL